ncbi:MAG: glutathione S-transferase [Pseudoruegeria sp.]
MTEQTILYTFRRCPYAMRARLALHVAGIPCELREIVLRDKAPEFLALSPKGTVPVLQQGETLLEESLDIMLWALSQNDPEGWLAHKAVALPLIKQSDGPFKTALDRYKYGSRFPGADASDERDTASEFLRHLNRLLTQSEFLHSARPTLADMAIVTFVRQFAFVDKEWFDAQDWPELLRWLSVFLESPRFTAIMHKYPKWVANAPVTPFPDL